MLTLLHLPEGCGGFEPPGPKSARFQGECHKPLGQQPELPATLKSLLNNFSQLPPYGRSQQDRAAYTSGHVMILPRDPHARLVSRFVAVEYRPDAHLQRLRVFSRLYRNCLAGSVVIETTFIFIHEDGVGFEPTGGTRRPPRQFSKLLPLAAQPTVLVFTSRLVFTLDLCVLGRFPLHLLRDPPAQRDIESVQRVRASFLLVHRGTAGCADSH